MAKDETENAEFVETTTDREASPTGEIGRHTHKGTLNVMWGGTWLALGDAEFIAENGRVVKVISFTPYEFPADR